MRTEIEATVEQLSPNLLGVGEEETIRMTKLGQIFTVDWKEKLLLAGRLWSITVGTIATGADVVEIVGGGSSTTIISKQAELAIGVPAGYFLIPVSCRASAHGDSGSADAAEANMVLFTDRTASIDLAAGTLTPVTPLNLLDGAGAFPGDAFKACTADTTTPTVADILDYESWQAAQVSAAGSLIASLKMNYAPKVPVILAGPCALYLCYGGTTAQNGMGTIVVGCVPSTWFPVV